MIVVQTIQRVTLPIVIASLVFGVLTVSLADKPDPPEQQQIRQALDGAETGDSGNGILDDVLDVIKHQGSILDGSVLDDSELVPEPNPALLSKHAIVAEQLLRAARLLESLEKPDRQRETLIQGMRGEARKLLSD